MIPIRNVVTICVLLSMGSLVAGRMSVPNLEQITREAKILKAGIALDTRTLDALSGEKAALTAEVQRLQELQRVGQLETSGKPIAYIIKVRIAQSHAFDIGAMIKDDMNACEVEIPVDKDYYASTNVGAPLANGFRMGSLLMEGSWGSWDVQVVGKRMQAK